MNNDIRKFFTREAVAASLQRLPEMHTPVVDMLFPETNRINHPLPTVGFEDLGLPSSNIPVVRRGSSSISIAPNDGSLKLIEPQPVSAHSFMDAATMNSLMSMTGQAAQQLIDNRIDSLRKTVRQTTEALASQVLTGRIVYPMKADGATLSYEVNFGTPATVTITKKWEQTTTTMADIVADLGKMVAELRKNGYGRSVKFLVDYDVYGVLIGKIGALPNSAIASLDGEGNIRMGANLTVTLMPASYTDLSTGNLVSGIPAKSILAVDVDAGHKLFYASVDDLDANFAGLPFFSKAIKVDDPSGYKIIGTGKPLPVVNAKALVKAVALT